MKPPTYIIDNEHVAGTLPPEIADELAPPIVAAFAHIEQLQTAIVEALGPWGANAVGEATEEVRFESKLVLVAAIRACWHLKTRLAETEKAITGLLDQITLDGERIVVDDVPYRISEGQTVRYDNERVASVFAGLLSDELVNRETGEVPPLPVIVEQAVTTTAKALGGLAASRAWGQTELKKRGINRAKFETERHGNGERRLKEERQ